MKRLLAISYCFPPVASPEAFVSAKLMGAITGFEVDVISASAELFPGQADHSLDRYVSERFRRVERVSAPWLLQQLMLMPRLPLRPDRYVLLKSLAINRALALNPGGYDAILTRSQYHSSHLVGLALKQQFPDTPWIASFSDPWTGGIYERSVPFLSKYSLELEERVLSGADSLIFPTREMCDFVSRQHDKLNIHARSSIIPHSFDPMLYDQPRARRSDEAIRIRIFGTFYGPRSPAPLLKALAILTERPRKPDFVVEVFGRNADVLNSALAQYPELKTIVCHMGELDHASALRSMANADILAMIDAPMPPPSIFMPSKLADYIGAGRPILAITPEGAAADIVRELGGLVAPPDEPDVIVGALTKLLEAAEKTPGETTELPRSAYNAKLADRFLAANLAQRLEQAINNTMARRLI